MNIVLGLSAAALIVCLASIRLIPHQESPAAIPDASSSVAALGLAAGGSTSESAPPASGATRLQGSNPATSQAGAAAASRTTPDYDAGISLGTDILALSPQQLDSELDDLAALHIGWIRIDFDWNSIQPRPDAPFTWGSYDRIVQAFNEHHMKTLAILDYSALWAVDPKCGSVRCPPADDSSFASFARAAASHFESLGVHDWEIWNEPNVKNSWLPAADPAGYANLLKAAYPAIHAADPDAVVISGGLAPAATGNGDIAPIAYVKALYDSGAGPYFDAVGFHPYSFPVLPSSFAAWNAWSQMHSTSPSIRSVMAANGDAGKKIWMTEFGAPTGGPGTIATSSASFEGHPDHVSETLQAAILSDAISLQKRYAWAGPLFLYTYRDRGTSASTNENFFGLLRFDGTRKPAYDALQAALSASN